MAPNVNGAPQQSEAPGDHSLNQEVISTDNSQFANCNKKVISTDKKCARCEKVWAKDAIPGHHFGVTSQGVVLCIDRRYCRARQLTATIDLGLFGRVPREHWWALMDVRPANWKETGWRPAHTEMTRVYACIAYHSWCFPACMEYACRLNLDDTDLV